jgi:hypothetical protein
MNRIQAFSCRSEDLPITRQLKTAACAFPKCRELVSSLIPICSKYCGLFSGYENGQTRSIVLLSIQLLSSAFRNFISSRTTVSLCG